MKFNILTITILAMSLIAIGTLITPENCLARKGVRYRTDAISSCQPGFAIPAHSYSDAMNTLFTTSGR